MPLCKECNKAKETPVNMTCLIIVLKFVYDHLLFTAKNKWPYEGGSSLFLLGKSTWSYSISCIVDENFPLKYQGTTYSVARMNPCWGLVESGSTVNLESETSNVTSAFSPKSLSITDTEGKKNDIWLLCMVEHFVYFHCLIFFFLLHFQTIILKRYTNIYF